MNLDDVKLSDLRGLEPQELLRAAFERFGERAAIGTSLQKTGVVILDMASRLGLPFRVFFVDTLMNHPETYELLEEVQKRYRMQIERFAPSEQSILELYKTFGQSAHYFGRELCCRVRKQAPLNKALATLDVWISGLRRDQSEHRRDNVKQVAFTADGKGRRIIKLNPLLDWTEDQIEDYTRREGLPYNKLYDYVSPYDERYTVLGCTPCHVPVKEGFDKRMGKFPWEHGKKECGIHSDGGGI